MSEYAFYKFEREFDDITSRLDSGERKIEVIRDPEYKELADHAGDLLMLAKMVSKYDQRR